MAERKTVVYLRDVPWGDDNEVEVLTMALQEEGIEPVFLANTDGEDVVPPDVLDDLTPDIVVIDYGGMSTMGAYDGAAANVRYVLRWAEDHPSTAIIVWTQFTQFIADDILQDFRKDVLGNVFVYQTDADDTLAWDAIRMWLGVDLEKGDDA